MFGFAVVVQILTGGEDSQAVLAGHPGVAAVSTAYMAPEMLCYSVRLAAQLTLERPASKIRKITTMNVLRLVV